MNLTLNRPRKIERKSAIKSICFNQFNGAVAIGTSGGYTLYDLRRSDLSRVNLAFDDNRHENVYIVERLYTSSVTASVSLNNPKEVSVYYVETRTDIATIWLPERVCSLRLNLDVMVVYAGTRLYIYKLEEEFELKYVLKDAPRDDSGLFALSPDDNLSYIAYPSDREEGCLEIFDANRLTKKCTIKAHGYRIVALTFNLNSSMLASASELGIVIRVHCVEGNTCLYEFRRSFARRVNISSLSFSLDSNFLAATSNTDTIHVFKLINPRKKLTKTSSLTELLSRALVQVTSFLSNCITDLLIQPRAFAYCRLPRRQRKNICAIKTIDGMPRVIAISEVAILYIFDIDVEKGGECNMSRQFQLKSKT